MLLLLLLFLQVHIIGVGDVVVDAVAMRNADVFMLYCS